MIAGPILPSKWDQPIPGLEADPEPEAPATDTAEEPQPRPSR